MSLLYRVVGRCPCVRGHWHSFLKLDGMRLPETLFCWIHIVSWPAIPPTHSHTCTMPSADCFKLHTKHLRDHSRAYKNSFYYLQVPHLCTFWSILQQEPPGRASGMARLSTLAILFISSSSNRKTILCSLRPRRVCRYCIRNQTLDHNCKNRKSNRAQPST